MPELPLPNNKNRDPRRERRVPKDAPINQETGLPMMEIPHVPLPRPEMGSGKERGRVVIGENPDKPETGEEIDEEALIEQIEREEKKRRRPHAIL